MVDHNPASLSATQLGQMADEAVALLEKLIAIPSISKEETHTAALIQEFFQDKNIPFHRKYNNIWAFNQHFDPKKPSLLLNSHHDTVKPNQGYSRDPFQPIKEDGKLFGLGSNDAGGALVCLIETFLYFYSAKLPYNLILAATAEEEISGDLGIASVLPELPELELAIVGEPTLMDLAVAEKGLMVVDATVIGKAGHAARNEGENAIYKALEDLMAIRRFRFKKTSPYLGESKVTATIIQAGQQHNVVPDRCTFTLDVRVTESYTLEEALAELKESLKATLVPRSLRLQASKLPGGHKIQEVILKMGLKTYGSPTLSDQALIPYPSVKLGPGDSARSHSPDEFIYITDIEKGIEGYINLLSTYIFFKK
ncbi:M20 family metallo-hydrolase [Pararhodonellum marinum]|uniref:M20 family metallo-hydrolase n=1 Tax=Pararhodonellum marinum TaxID=2755358 RepID=UPI001E658C79|nr:M20 family metallo-hydrolase [Pararhodonellum marinum]